MIYKFKVGDKVVYTNIFGVCWGVKTIIECMDYVVPRKDDDPMHPHYHYEGSDTPWCPVEEERLTLATEEDLVASAEDLQAKYGFTPTEWYGCY